MAHSTATKQSLKKDLAQAFQSGIGSVMTMLGVISEKMVRLDEEDTLLKLSMAGAYPPDSSVCLTFGAVGQTLDKIDPESNDALILMQRRPQGPVNKRKKQKATDLRWRAEPAAAKPLPLHDHT